MIPYLKGLPISTFNNFYNRLPFTGRSDYFGSISSMQNFGPALVIKMVPFRDMSMDYPYKETDFDKFVFNVINNLPVGSPVTAVKMGTARNQKNGTMVSGQVTRIISEYETDTIRIYVLDTKSGEESEVYPETIFREIERLPQAAPATPKIFEY